MSRTLVLLTLAACTGSPAALTGEGWREPAEDAVFHQEPRWLGGDGAYTIDLGGDRTLWLFGDSFVATSPAHVRTEAVIVRNSIAVMTGRDLHTASMQFAWHDSAMPSSFFPEVGDHWFWPSDGALAPDGSLVVLLNEVRATPGAGLGFAAAGYRAVRIADPSGDPASWQLTALPTTPAPYDATAGIACSVRDGDYLVALVANTDSHHTRLARWSLVNPAALAAPQWWDGSAWRTDAPDPAVVIDDDGGSECSVQQIAGQWVYVQSLGFGSTTIAIRTAPRLEGPWSNPTDVFTPPESNRDDAFVYAGKGHLGLTAHEAGANLVVTYADNSFTFSDLLAPANAATLGWPHVAEIALH